MLALVLGTSSLLTVLIVLIIAFAVVGLIAYIVNQMAPPAQVRWLIWAIVLVVVLGGACSALGIRI
jgi:hypothetical protein